MLPVPQSETEYERLAAEYDFGPAVAHLAHAHQLRGECSRYAEGTAVVHAVGEHVIKLYPPLYGADADVEASVLAALRDEPGVPAPPFVVRGKLGEWPFVVMGRLGGEVVDDLWPTLPAEERRACARNLGHVLSALHGTDVRGLPELDHDWDSFQQRMRERGASHHLAYTLQQPYRAQLEGYLEELRGEPEAPFEPALLHTEVGPGHVLWDGSVVCGLFDFGESVVGDPEYDVATVGVFVTRGDAGAFTAFLDAYGLPPDRRGPGLVRRLMRHCLQHRYGRLGWYLERVPAPGASDLREVAQFWFGHD